MTTSKALLADMLKWSAWANDALYQRAAEMPDEELRKVRPSIMKSVLVQLNHFIVIDRVWMAHMQQRPHGFEALQTMLHEDLSELIAARKEMDAELAAYLESLDEAGLDEVVEYELIGGNKGRMSRAMIFTHIVTHHSYHRGWTVEMFGNEQFPPGMDLPVYERAMREGG